MTITPEVFCNALSTLAVEFFRSATVFLVASVGTLPALVTSSRNSNALARLAPELICPTSFRDTISFVREVRAVYPIVTLSPNFNTASITTLELCSSATWNGTAMLVGAVSAVWCSITPPSLVNASSIGATELVVLAFAIPFVGVISAVCRSITLSMNVDAPPISTAELVVLARAVGFIRVICAVCPAITSLIPVNAFSIPATKFVRFTFTVRFVREILAVHTSVTLSPLVNTPAGCALKFLGLALAVFFIARISAFSSAVTAEVQGQTALVIVTLKLIIIACFRVKDTVVLVIPIWTVSVAITFFARVYARARQAFVLVALTALWLTIAGDFIFAAGAIGDAVASSRLAQATATTTPELVNPASGRRALVFIRAIWTFPCSVATSSDRNASSTVTPKLVESTPSLTIELIAPILAVVVAITLPGLVDANAIATPELIVAAWAIPLVGAVRAISPAIA